MKRLLAVLAFAALTAGASAQSTPQDFDFDITGETSREQLSELRQQLGELGYDFSYQPSFDLDLKLTTIVVKLVEMEGEFKAGYETSQLQAGEVVTLRRQTDEEGKVTFCVGHCD